MGHTGPVLVVDDDPIVLGVICRALEEEGLVVVAAANGRLALEQASQRRPALVVLDVSLPVLGSDAVAAGVHALAGEHVPILVITAGGHPAEKARTLGAYAYLSKPFDVDQLIGLVRRGLHGA